METSTWMTVDEVSERLGVRPETVYAYVSRGVLQRRRAADGRRSLFASADVERLARRGRPRLATAQRPAIDVPIRTSVAAVEDGRLTFRGIPIDEIVEVGFESVLEVMWETTGPVELHWPSDAAAPPVPPGSPSVFDRLAIVALWAGAADPVRAGHDRVSVLRAGTRLIPAFVVAAGADGGPGRRTVAARLSELVPGRARARRRVTEVFDAALTVLADHELATSTMAVRVAASTRADPYQCVVAGLAALSGPLHGSASRMTHGLMLRVLEDGPDVALREVLRSGGRVPGFGHVLYRRADDPRATALLDRWRAVATADQERRVDRLVEVVEEHVGFRPNVDLALGVITATLGIGPDVGEELFSIARTAGWLAHVAEEYDEPALRFRPRRVSAVPRR